jgi:Xaa-Pro aminopeptidase
MKEDKGKLMMMNRHTEGPRRTSVTNRLRKLRVLVEERGLDAILISQRENICYLSGFTGSSGWLLISQQSAVLATDFRYTEQARGESPDFEITQTKGQLHDWLPGMTSDSGWRKLGLEANSISYDSYKRLNKATKTSQVSLKLVATAGIVEQLRSIKEPEELVFLKKAVELTDTVFEQAKSAIRPGITEKKAAWEIEKTLRQEGSEGIPFEIIVASGSNSALPHAQPTEKAICADEPVLIDMGARVNGYCSDFSRTIFFGKTNRTFRRIYDIVLKAQTSAIEKIESNMDASQADRFARSVIEQAGYGDCFGHGLGHGVGLAVHESPTINPSSPDILTDGMVFSVEPGIYLSGQGGVRIEDLVVLENGKAKVLSRGSEILLS